jgi:hypothetical protein
LKLDVHVHALWVYVEARFHLVWGAEGHAGPLVAVESYDLSGFSLHALDLNIFHFQLVFHRMQIISHVLNLTVLVLYKLVGVVELRLHERDLVTGLATIFDCLGLRPLVAILGLFLEKLGFLLELLNHFGLVDNLGFELLYLVFDRCLGLSTVSGELRRSSNITFFLQVLFVEQELELTYGDLCHFFKRPAAFPDLGEQGRFVRLGRRGEEGLHDDCLHLHGSFQSLKWCVTGVRHKIAMDYLHFRRTGC